MVHGFLFRLGFRLESRSRDSRNRRTDCCADRYCPKAKINVNSGPRIVRQNRCHLSRNKRHSGRREPLTFGFFRAGTFGHSDDQEQRNTVVAQDNTNSNVPRQLGPETQPRTRSLEVIFGAVQLLHVIFIHMGIIFLGIWSIRLWDDIDNHHWNIYSEIRMVVVKVHTLPTGPSTPWSQRLMKRAGWTMEPNLKVVLLCI